MQSKKQMKIIAFVVSMRKNVKCLFVHFNCFVFLQDIIGPSAMVSPPACKKLWRQETRYSFVRACLPCGSLGTKQLASVQQKCLVPLSKNWKIFLIKTSHCPHKRHKKSHYSHKFHTFFIALSSWFQLKKKHRPAQAEIARIVASRQWLKWSKIGSTLL